MNTEPSSMAQHTSSFSHTSFHTHKDNILTQCCASTSPRCVTPRRLPARQCITAQPGRRLKSQPAIGHKNLRVLPRGPHMQPPFLPHHTSESCGAASAYIGTHAPRHTESPQRSQEGCCTRIAGRSRTVVSGASPSQHAATLPASAQHLSATVLDSPACHTRRRPFRLGPQRCATAEQAASVLRQTPCNGGGPTLHTS